MKNSIKLGSLFFKNNITFCTGVPDSLLKPFLKNIKKVGKFKHIQAVNEGNAVSLAAGWQTVSNKVPLVYMQNSGLGNAINPLISLTHSKVYSIPLVLLIGWRGEPNKHDEPQHIEMGKITLDILKLLNIKTIILGKKFSSHKVNELINYSIKNKKVVAFLVKKEFFNNEGIKEKNNLNSNNILRYNFLETLVDEIEINTRIISSTGYTSRELDEIRKRKINSKGKDFYMVGAMGHTSIFSLGVAEATKKKIICIDGDGSMLMHFGSLFTIGQMKKTNLKYILLNNNCHESVGSQKTNINNVNINIISKGLGFQNYTKISNKKNMRILTKKFLNSKKSNFLEVRIKNISIENLGRPKNLKKILANFSF